ncbi:riboflavin synthase [Janibacter sp. Y6]|uniref:riboflavin synthase n=1 Tax=Janibacter sp. Y6 TaxID=2913552 RepID=UPI0034A34633
MFTGIIEEVGTVLAVEHEQPGDGGEADVGSARMTIEGPGVLVDARPGCSIAVGGVCLTVVEHDGERFTADVMGETLRWTTLGGLAPGDPVNLERALRADGRLDGHVVQGHVDGVGEVVARTAHERWEVLEVSVPDELRPHLVRKGSVAVDGTSLTVSGLTDAGFEVSLIPTTLAETTLGRRAVGDRVNLETDVLAKYVAGLLGDRQAAS